jgi:prepilin-type N-terminal cleavage/methylation domain-containing protein/prepilin-type processing-associated H-X9-DG protein
MYPTRTAHPARSGFTLVELLVVIAIIAVLVMLLLPAIQAARQAAIRTMCVNHMRQIGIATASYAGTHNGKFPETYHEGDAKSWVYRLAPYMENVDEIRICPEDEAGMVRLKHHGTSYVLNEYVTLHIPNAVHSIEKLATSKTMIVFEGADSRDPESFYFEHVHPSEWFTERNRRLGRVWIRLRQDIHPERHHGSTSNYLYADAHVATIPVSAIRAWVDDDYNFAAPNQGAYSP